MPRYEHDGVTINFEDEGSGEPVVLVHGFPLSADLWMPQRAALSQTHRVITPNLRGFGGSGPVPAAPSLNMFADDIVAVMDALGIGQATVAGLSMGGYIVMALLRRHPERVRGVMLVATKSTPDTEAGKQGRNDMIALVQNEGTRAVAEKMLPQVLTEHTQATDTEMVAFVRAMMEASSVEGVVGAATALRDRPDSTPTLAAATVPALIVVGADDKLTTVKDAQAMHAVHPNAELVTIPDAAHLVNLEQPSAVNEAMLAFLERTTGV